MNIRIVTDSTSDLPKEYIHQYQINVIPNIIILDGKSYLDGLDISRERFYESLPGLKQNPTTATASVGTYFEIYNTLFKQGADQILSIHPPMNLSGIVNAASTAAQHFDGKVKVIDSQQLTLGLGFQVITAAKAAQQGKSIHEILDQLADLRSRLSVVAMLETLNYVQRSGRVSWTKSRLASLLNLHAFLELKDGEIRSLGETRTRRKGIERLVALLRESGQLQSLVILHTNAKSDAEVLKRRFESQSIDPTWVCNVTTVIGTHVGPNALGFVAVKSESGSTPG